MKIRSSRDDGEFKRGEEVTLNCTTICSIHQLEVTWFRDGSNLSESGPALHLSYLTAKDSGNYTCSLKKNKRTLSEPYSLHVEADEEGGGNPGRGGGLPLIVGLVVGVLLVLFAVILVVCIIKRKRAAGRDQTAVGRDEEQKHSDNIYSNDFLPLAEQQGPSSAVEEVSYASVQFTHKKQARIPYCVVGSCFDGRHVSRTCLTASDSREKMDATMNTATTAADTANTPSTTACDSRVGFNEGSALLIKANKQIANLKEDILRLSEELRRKDSLLSSYVDLACGQSRKLASLDSTLQDTVTWDPAACQRPSSCSTPLHGSSWIDVVVRSRKRGSDGTVSPSLLSLSNRYAALAVENPVLTVGASAAPSRPNRVASTTPVNPVGQPPKIAEKVDAVEAPEESNGKSTRRPPSTRTSSASARRRILKEAVLRHSGGLPRPDLADRQRRRRTPSSTAL
ncbi:hypothetical protein PFLUV_G00091680 [Perca fluviatilis]|uniref:Ig-like domain-containing protein n=1 Tax=Perca fluviatilis TaxID=8168 RepID=A0A6A5EH38_PERFL|nr:hypothetical protein PFLUV_G00091680 [Perca fluviatilis]